MSKFVDEIVKSINDEPDLWLLRDDHKLRKDDIAIYSNCGVAAVIVGGRVASLTFFDEFKIIKAHKKWMRLSDLTRLRNEKEA